MQANIGVERLTTLTKFGFHTGNGKGSDGCRGGGGMESRKERRVGIMGRATTARSAVARSWLV